MSLKGSVRLFHTFPRLILSLVEVMVSTEAILRHALQEGVKITLVVNKIDRLILELRIKPADAFYKIKHTIEEVNTFIRSDAIHLL
jgi:U5 small nuclear ribonucleoprotein component